MTRFVTGHLAGVDIDGEHVCIAVDTCDNGCFSWRERVALLPREDGLLVWFLQDDGVKGVGGIFKEHVGLDDGADFVEFLDGEGVEWVVGDVGGVVARGVGGGGLEEVWFLKKEAVLGGGAVPRPRGVGGAVF